MQDASDRLELPDQYSETPAGYRAIILEFRMGIACGWELRRPLPPHAPTREPLRFLSGPGLQKGFSNNRNN